MKLRNQLILKGIEGVIFIWALFITFCDFMLPKSLTDQLHQFGLVKLAILGMLVLISAYLSFGLREKDYLKHKFTTKHLSRALLVVSLCLFLYIMIMFKVSCALEQLD